MIVLLKKVKKYLIDILLFFVIEVFPYQYAKHVYKVRTGKILNYESPKDMNEKLFWLARYWQHPLIVSCTDKLQVRKYVRDCGYEDILNDLYRVYDHVNEINFDKLPKTFALKCNHGCGYNVLCKNKDCLDVNDAKLKLQKWMSEVFGVVNAEFHYRSIVPKILHEEYICDPNYEKLEIQVFCFNGEPNSFLVRNDLGDKGKEPFAVSYSLDWRRVEYRKNENMSIEVEKPVNYEKIIQYATLLAKPFPHVRVDFYELGNRLIFSELTFTTSGNVLSNYRDEVVKMWGEKLILPNRISNKWKKRFHLRLFRSILS